MHLYSRVCSHGIAVLGNFSNWENFQILKKKLVDKL